MTVENLGWESYVLIAEQAMWGTPAGASDLTDTIFEVLSTSLRRVSEPITRTPLRGNASALKNTQGMIRVEGDIVLQMHSYGIGVWLKQLMMATTQTTTQNTAQTVFTQGSYVATAFSLTDDPEDVLTAPSTAGKLIFEFAGASGTGTIKIEGRDINGLRLAETLSASATAPSNIALLAASAYTSAQTALTSNPIDVLTSPATAGVLVLTFAGASGSGNVTLVGDNANGSSVTETIAVDIGANTTYTSTNSYSDNVMFTIGSGISGGTLAISVTPPSGLESKYHYKSDVEITITGISGGTLQITTDPGTYNHELRLTNEILEGITAEIVKGQDTPNTYDSLVVTQGVLNLADIVTLTLSFLGREGDLRRGIAGTRGTPTDISAYSRAAIDVAPNWGMAFEINDVVYPVSDATMTVNNNIDFPSTRFAKTVYYPKPTRQGSRNVTISATIDYTLSNDFDALARGDEISAKLLAVTTPLGGPYTGYEFNFPQAELVGFPDPEIPDMSEITQTLDILAYTSTSALGNDEVVLTITSTESSI